MRNHTILKASTVPPRGVRIRATMGQLLLGLATATATRCTVNRLACSPCRHGPCGLAAAPLRRTNAVSCSAPRQADLCSRRGRFRRAVHLIQTWSL